ncbi:MAG: hypothetical protein ACEY29_00185 [Arsenophonus sp.]
MYVNNTFNVAQIDYIIRQYKPMMRTQYRPKSIAMLQYLLVIAYKQFMLN